MKKSIYFFMVCLTGCLFSCSDDEQITQQSETSSENLEVTKRRMPFEKTPHYAKVKMLINEMSQSLNNNLTLQKGQGEYNSFDILTDEVIYMEYENSHSYTFKVRRSNPEFYIENVVLNYNPETEDYDEYLIQYLVNESQFLDIVNDNYPTGELTTIAQKFENGTFSNVLGRLSCVTSCVTVNVNCTNGGNHEPGETCTEGPASGYAYSYVSCHTTCIEFREFEQYPEYPWHSGGGGGGNGTPVNTYPLPLEPCEGTGLDNGNGMCIIPWVASMNNPLLNINERRILTKYFYIFQEYFNGMDEQADHGFARSLINYLIINDNPNGEEFAYWAAYYVMENPDVTWTHIQRWFINGPNLSPYLMSEYLSDLNNPNTVKPTKKFKNHAKINGVYNKVKNAANFRQYLQNFEPTFSVAHLLFDVGECEFTESLAETSAPDNYWILITLPIVHYRKSCSKD